MTDKEKTAPNEPTAIGSEQSSTHNYIIANSDEKVKNYKDMIRQKLDKSYMSTISMPELYENIYNSQPPIIEGLLYSGTYLFVGAPKVGKSFFMLQLAYHISTGLPLWDYSVRKGTVLYLALEDNYHRIQERLYRMFGTDCAPDLHFSVSAHQLGKGLNEQLQGFISEHPDTRLIIIDTLQKVRELDGETYSYANDYEIITQLKEFADAVGICLLLVHHTRKQKSDDSFDMISGTNGLLGAADGAFLLRKEKRTSNAATLEISGRDQQDQKLHLVRNVETLKWEFESAETELWKEPPDPLLEKISQLVTDENPDWFGTATELVAVLAVDISANSITKKLNVNASRLLNEYKIAYRQGQRSSDKRQLELHKVNDSK